MELKLKPLLMQSLESGSVAFIMITMWYCPLLGILREKISTQRTAITAAGSAAFCGIENILLLSSTSSAVGRLVFLVRDRRLHFLEGHTRTQRACEVRQCVCVKCSCCFCFLLLIYSQRRPTSLPLSLFMSFCCVWRRQRFMLDSLTLPLTLSRSLAVSPPLPLLLCCAPLSAVSGITAFQSRFRSNNSMEKEW